jgi:MFS family permease
MLLEPLRHKAFRRLAGGRAAAYLGNGIAPPALAFAVLDLSGSVVDLGMVVGARSIATVILLLLGGVLADRLPRALLLRGATSAGAVTQAAIAASVVLHWASIPLLMGLSLVNGAVTAVSMPAASAMTPQTVPAHLVRTANAVTRIGTNTGIIAGSSLGGLLAALAGPGWAIGASAIAFLVSALCYAALPTTVPAAPQHHDGMLTQLRDGWREFAARPWVWVVVLQFMIVNAALVGGIQVLGPLVADETFGRTAWGVVLAAQTTGALVGGFVAARWRPRRALLIGVALIPVEALPLLVLAVAPNTVLLGCAMFIGGLTMEQFGVAWEVALQENIPPDRLARVYSYDALGSFVAIPIGQIGIGPVAGAFGAEFALVATATLVIAASVAAVASRSVRSLTATQPGEDDAEGPLPQVGVPAESALADRGQ